MKKVVISALGALMVTAGSFAATDLNHTEAATQKVTQVNHGLHYITNAVEMDLTKLPEYAVVKATIDLNAYKGQVVEDNKANRIIVYKDANGRQQYKSIFVKRDNRLKIINYKGGMLVNQVIKSSVATTNAPAKTQAVATKKNNVQASGNLTGLKAVVVQDNYAKRITLYKDAKGNAKYKKILVKKTGFEKLIRI